MPGLFIDCWRQSICLLGRRAARAVPRPICPIRDVELDTAVGPTCQAETSYVPLFGFFNEDFWIHSGVGPSERMRLIVLDVPDGQNIVILITAGDVPSFDARISDAMAIVNNLSFAIG